MIAPDLQQPQQDLLDLRAPAAPRPYGLAADHVLILAGLAVGSTLLIVLLASRDAGSAIAGVLPAVLLAFGCAAGCGFYLLSRPAAHPWALLCLPALACAVGMLGAVALHAATHRHPVLRVLAWPLVQKALVGAPLFGAMLGASLLLLMRAQHRERAAWERASAERLHAETLERERAQADLQLLQAQVEPHFLYNTLANLRHLIAHDSTRAAAMLEHLIRYFKLALPGFRLRRQPLGDQIALVQSYLALMRERREAPIVLDLQVPGDWMDLPLPPGVLLCLVENAVKHGLPEGDAAPVVRIAAAHRDAQRLRLCVRDNGPGLAERVGSAESTGTGLSNLRERLRLSHGERAALRLREHEEGGCEAILEWPWEEHEPDACGDRR
ncbi:MAG TPA: histidine kinase [Burkholderiaceae bacterium]